MVNETLVSGSVWAWVLLQLDCFCSEIVSFSGEKEANSMVGRYRGQARWSRF